jgi:hypothetical protein
MRNSNPTLDAAKGTSNFAVVNLVQAQGGDHAVGRAVTPAVYFLSPSQGQLRDTQRRC